MQSVVIMPLIFHHHRHANRVASHATKRRTRWIMNSRRALSLLEVMLAIAILGGSLAVLGELLRLGSRSAARARDLTTAEILCETKMAEVTSGIEPSEAVSASPIDDSGEWLYSVEVAAAEQEGLLAVTVTVEQSADAAGRPVRFALSRWMIDPTVQESAEAAAEEAAALAASQSGQSASAGSDGTDDTGDSGTGGTGGTGTGGGTGGGNSSGGGTGNGAGGNNTGGGGTPSLPQVPDFSTPPGGGGRRGS